MITIREPLFLLALVLALAPILWRRPRTLFFFSSLSVVRRSRLSRVVSVGLRISAVVAILCLAGGSAGVVIEYVTPEEIEDGAEIVFVRDGSGSMFTVFEGSKIKKQKITVATEVIARFVRIRGRDRYALVDFGSATVTRWKLDFDKEQFLEVLRFPLMDLGGTVIDQALARAFGLFQQERSFGAKAVILVSDGWGSLNNISDVVRWAREWNVNVWWVFIGSKYDSAMAAEMHTLIERLGSQGKMFHAGSPAELEKATAEIRTLERGLIKYPREVSGYPLDHLFYLIAYGCMVALVVSVAAELLVAPKREEA